MPIMEIKIMPIGTQSASVSKHVAKAIKTLEQAGVKYQVTPMGTIVEADSVERLFDIAKLMHQAALDDLDRIVTFIELDERKDKPLTMAGKLKSVEQKIKT